MIFSRLTFLAMGRSGFVNTTELSCFFRPLAFRGSSATILARPALYKSPTSLQCLIPAAEEFPLPCTCVCASPSATSSCQANLRATYGGSGPTRSNTTKYDTNGVPIVSSQSISAAMCTCCPGTGKGNCSVSVGVGVNLQLSKYGGDDSNFLYSLDSPVVCCNPVFYVCAFVSVMNVSCKWWVHLALAGWIIHSFRGSYFWWHTNDGHRPTIPVSLKFESARFWADYVFVLCDSNMIFDPHVKVLIVQCLTVWSSIYLRSNWKRTLRIWTWFNKIIFRCYPTWT